MGRLVKYGRVLLADSHLNTLAGVHSLLEMVFDSVLMASDEASLLGAIGGLHPDLVVADLSLPCPSKEAGLNLATRLKAKFPSLPLIVLSVHDDPVVVTAIQSAGAAGFVLKRAVAVDLIPAVREVMAGRVYVSPAVQWSEPKPTG
jgi:DNA-binding NarL/FixJ family response regulator